MTDTDTQLAITRLINLYCHYFDSGNSDGFASLWSTGGILTIGGTDDIAGRPAILRWFEATTAPRRFMHIVTNIIIDKLSASECVAQSYVAAYRPFETNSTGLIPTALGTYHDAFVLEGGLWLLKHRVVAFAARAPQQLG